MNLDRDQGVMWSKGAVQRQQLTQRYPGVRHETATGPVQLPQPPTDPLPASYKPQASYDPLYAPAPLNPQASSYAQAPTDPLPTSDQQQPSDPQPRPPLPTRLQQPGGNNSQIVVQPPTDDLFQPNPEGQNVYRASPQVGASSEGQLDIQSSVVTATASGAADVSDLNQYFAAELLDQALEEQRLDEAVASWANVGAGAGAARQRPQAHGLQPQGIQQQGAQPQATRPRRSTNTE
ncbi:hypothetical protein BDW69DRAFT_125180 [Aspergillus filifer]